MGRSGANVKSIEERTGAKITFREKEAGFQMCEIVGQYEDVMKAAKLVDTDIKRFENITDELLIPSSEKTSMKNLQVICRETFTSVCIAPGPADKNKRKIIIKGSFPNVQKAKRKIEEIVRQEIVNREVEKNREPRHNQKNSSTNSSMESLSKQSRN